MNAADLRERLDAAGYADAELRNGRIHVRDRKSGMTYRDHREVLKGAGIPIAWGGVDLPGWYWFSVKLTEVEA